MRCSSTSRCRGASSENSRLRFGRHLVLVARQKLFEPETPSIGDRIGTIRDGHWQTRQMPTATQRRSLEIAKAGLAALERDLKALIAGDLAKLEEAFAAAGAPWTPGRRVP